MLSSEPPDEIVDVDVRHRVVLDRDDGVVFGPQMPEIVERVIGVVPKERAL